MSRDYAAIYTSVWNDRDWTRLTPELQHAYWLILTQPKLTPCGVLDWIPSRYGKLAAGLTVPVLTQRVDALCAASPRPWLIRDADSAELLVRSFVKWDNLLTGLRPAKAIAKDYASVSSDTLRDAIVQELHERYRREPKLAGWRGIEEQDADLMDLIKAGAVAA